MRGSQWGKPAPAPGRCRRIYHLIREKVRKLRESRPGPDGKRLRRNLRNFWRVGFKNARVAASHLRQSLSPTPSPPSPPPLPPPPLVQHDALQHLNSLSPRLRNPGWQLLREYLFLFDALCQRMGCLSRRAGASGCMTLKASFGLLFSPSSDARAAFPCLWLRKCIVTFLVLVGLF